MPELNSLSEPVEHIGDITDPTAPLAKPSRIEMARVVESDEERNERTFFRGRVLRKVRNFVTENGPLAAMLAVVFVNMVGFGIIVPLMAVFAQSLNADPWQVTLMFSAYSLGQFFAEPFFGRLSDRIGRKPILVVTTALSILFYAALAYSPNIWAAIIIRFFSGLSSSNISTVQGYVSDVSRPEQRAGRLGLIGAAFSLGFLVGPVIGSVLGHSGLDGSQFRMPLIGSAVLSGIACLGVIMFVRESRERVQSNQESPNLIKTAQIAARNPIIARVILATLCYMAALAALESTFTLWAEARYHWGPGQIAVIFLCIGVTSAVMQMIVVRPLVRRYGESRVLAGGLFLFGSSFALQALNQANWLITPIVMLGTVGQAVIFSSICAIISLSTASDRQGAMLGLNMSTGAVARIAGPMFGGFLFSRFGADAPLWMGAALTIPAGLLALQIGKVQKR